MPKKKVQPVDVDKLQTTDRDTMLFYKGRHPAFPGYHFYVVKDTNKEITFKKKLRPFHKIGLGYPTTITKEGRSYGSDTVRPSIDNIEVWGNKVEIMSWIRDDESAAREAKRKGEEAGLRTKARKLAQQIKDEYRRASGISKRDIIAAFVEELET